jgi:Kef-type K+ transport system membrane component KefB
MELTGEERERLAARAEKRSRDGNRVVIVVVAIVGLLAVVLGIVVALATGDDSADDPAIWAVSGIPIVVAVVLAFVLTRLMRKVRQPLLAGADKATQKAVQQALKAGHTDDPRIDALVQDLRQDGDRRTLFGVALFAVAAICQIITAVLTDITWVRILFVGTALLSLVVVGQLRIGQRRLQRYGR